MKKQFILLTFLVFFLAPLSVMAEVPSYPILLETAPEQPSLKATISLSDDTILKDIFIISSNEETDPGAAILQFFREPLKSSVYIKDIKIIEFLKTEGEQGIYSGDHLKLTLKNGKSDKVTYLSGLNDGITAVYLDNFSDHYQKIYIPIYKKDAAENGKKKLHVKKILFTE